MVLGQPKTAGVLEGSDRLSAQRAIGRFLISKCLMWSVSTMATLGDVSVKMNGPSWKRNFGKPNEVTALDAAMAFC